MISTKYKIKPTSDMISLFKGLRGMEKGKKILLVDDEEGLLLTVGYILEHAGYSVVKAKDGQEAVEQAKKEKPDLILLDIHMPVLDGMKAGEIIQSDPETRDIPIIYHTCLLSKKDEQKLEKNIAGNFFLAKPCDPKELLDTIKERI